MSVRQQQKVEELCAAALRALTGEADLHFRGRRVVRAGRMLPAFGPHLHPSLEHDDFNSFRGAADAIALRLTLSDAALHGQLAPADPVERAVFELVEQLRVESLAPAHLPGLRHNVDHRFERWAEGFHGAGMAESARGVLLFTLALTVRARLCATPVPERLADLIEVTRGALVERIGTPLAALRRCREDQASFAVPARAIAASVAAMLAEHGVSEAQARVERDIDDGRAGFSLLMERDDEGDGGIALAASGRSRVLEASADGYRVFTRAYDREAAAASLVRTALLAEYRERLDARIAAQGFNVGRLARQLKALLATPQADGWDGAQEEGRIDGRRLATLVASPAERRLFRAERTEPAADCLVTFLIDCSGSMKSSIETVAMIVDVFARALETAGVACEVLGFTTGAWNGGRARRDWQRAGEPPHPGRLNEASHLVFKDAESPWRRARRGIAALLKPDLFREGIDGEAVEWAAARMLGRDERRRILLVVSDGSPMDTATNLANDAHYLDHHLREVVQRHAAGGIEIGGIGVGLDLSPYYERSRALDLDAPPGNRVFHDILELIAGPNRR